MSLPTPLPDGPGPSSRRGGAPLFGSLTAKSDRCLACREPHLESAVYGADFAAGGRKIKCLGPVAGGTQCPACQTADIECVYKERQKPGLKVCFLFEAIWKLDADLAVQTGIGQDLLDRVS